ncbi:hypothetical protein PAPYR_3832 [Paratrimastix pyriformis]|uniref:Uncharacterized protein n=1 Tax=Paratrimastix pyriformis TaxID=342808 RepID=A0ABQ8UNT4_9EUKA|nr:hypothetical protein PAPYR_3832 [Paratrimastix pyriformis]
MSVGQRYNRDGQGTTKIGNWWEERVLREQTRERTVDPVKYGTTPFVIKQDLNMATFETTTRSVHTPQVTVRPQMPARQALQEQAIEEAARTAMSQRSTVYESPRPASRDYGQGFVPTPFAQMPTHCTQRNFLPEDPEPKTFETTNQRLFVPAARLEATRGPLPPEDVPVTIYSRALPDRTQPMTAAAGANPFGKCTDFSCPITQYTKGLTKN